MKLEDQVCNLELAKRLKELGVKQESAFYWGCRDGQNINLFSLDTVLDWGLEETFEPCDQDVSAFTVAELGEILPLDRLCTNKNSKVAVWFDSAIPPTESIITGTTEADARAKMLIHLIEKGIVKP